MDLPLAYTFSAGMLASVNPCGAVMLPAWVSYYLSKDESSRSGALPDAARAITAGLVATTGFVLLFVIVGAVVSLGGRVIIGAVPWAVVGIGALLVAVGVGAFFGRTPHLALSGFASLPAAGTGWRGVFLFGVVYAIASLSCTLPVFLIVVGAALAAGGLLGGVVLFLSYGLGMGVVLTGVTLGAALFKTAVAAGLGRIAPYVERASAVMLIGAGLYLVISQLPYALS